MEEKMKNHSLTLNGNENGTVMKITGVTGVKTLVDKEAQISLEDGVLIVRGSGITANKFDVDDGNLELNATNLVSLTYGGGRQKTAFKDIFK